MLLLALAGACVGEPAPDVALCRDVAHRLCIAPRCSSVQSLWPDATCEETMLARTGCASDEFVFTSPTRERWVECRVMLVRSGTNVETKPDCLDVDQFLAECPDVGRFLQSGAPQ